MDNDGLKLVAPRIAPILDPQFRPAVLANRAFWHAVRSADEFVPVRLALEQSDGSVFHYATQILPGSDARAAGNFRYLERLVKFLLWSRGGFRIYFAGPAPLAERLQTHFRETPSGKFD